MNVTNMRKQKIQNIIFENSFNYLKIFESLNKDKNSHRKYCNYHIYCVSLFAMSKLLTIKLIIQGEIYEPATSGRTH